MGSKYSGMISEDYSEPGNMPREVKRANYPKKTYFNSMPLNDDITGIDKQINDSVKKIKKNSKY